MKTAVLGGGNMGGAIAKGLALNGGYEVVVTHAREDLRKWNEAHKCPIMFSDSSDNNKAVQDASIIVLAVKPYKVADVLSGITGCKGFKDKIIISVAAGITCHQLQEMCGNTEQSVFRIIPNTAIMLGQSATFISCSTQCNESSRLRVREIFASMGKVYEVSEDQMSALTAISSCGIAYVMRFIADIAEAGNKAGLDRSLSMDVTLQTMRGAVAILEREGTDAEMEIKRVCTPGGITEKGLKAMAEHGFTEAVEAGIIASTK